MSLMSVDESRRQCEEERDCVYPDYFHLCFTQPLRTNTQLGIRRVRQLVEGLDENGVYLELKTMPQEGTRANIVTGLLNRLRIGKDLLSGVKNLFTKSKEYQEVGQESVQDAFKTALDADSKSSVRGSKLSREFLEKYLQDVDSRVVSVDAQGMWSVGSEHGIITMYGDERKFLIQDPTCSKVFVSRRLPL